MNQESRHIMYKLFAFFILTSYFLLLTSESASAFTAQNNDYIFRMHITTDTDQQNLPYNQPGKFIINKSTQKLTPTPTPIPIIVPPKTTIQIGYTPTIEQTDFRFTLSDDSINYGPISPTDFILRQSSLAVSGDPSYLYSVIVYENHALKSEQNQSIPNTSCDDGTCTDTSAATWTDTLTFGFGYSCENVAGLDCEKNFVTKDSFKKFSVGGNNQNGAIILDGITSQERKAHIIYKINVPGSQQLGTYQNTITYLAVPRY